MATKKIENIEHYRWGHNYDGWELFRSNSLCVIQISVAQQKIPIHPNHSTEQNVDAFLIKELY